MSTLELNAYNFELLPQIQLPAMPTDLLCQLMDNSAKQDAEGLYLTDEQLEKEMQKW